MIRAFFLITLLVCLAAGPATAEGLWIFGKKKSENAAPESTSIFNKPKEKKAQAKPKESLINKLFGPGEQKKEDPDVVINGIKFKGLKKSMLSTSYIPKSPEEIMLVAFAHKSWEGDIMAAKAADAQKRIEKARLISEAAMEKTEHIFCPSIPKVVFLQGLFIIFNMLGLNQQRKKKIISKNLMHCPTIF